MSSFYAQDIVSWQVALKHPEISSDVIKKYRFLSKEEERSLLQLNYRYNISNIIFAVNKALAVCVYRIDSSFDDLKTYEDLSVGILEDHLTSPSYSSSLVISAGLCVA